MYYFYLICILHDNHDITNRLASLLRGLINGYSLLKIKLKYIFGCRLFKFVNEGYKNYRLERRVVWIKNLETEKVRERPIGSF